MAHRLAPGAEVELDEIWLWTAKESGSVDIADRLIDSITERLFLLARYPHMGRPRDNDLRPGLCRVRAGHRSSDYARRVCVLQT
jgi:plasmid stabilization system protein ParE